MKFRSKLVESILDGSKRTTCRLFDEKDIKANDELIFVVWETGEQFAEAKVVSAKETELGKLTHQDWEGHEHYESDEQMYEVYEKYYRRPISKDSPVKIIQFELKK